MEKGAKMANSRGGRYSYDRQYTSITALLIKIILLVSLAFGSTYALFTNREEVDMTVSAAEMGMKLYRTDESLGGSFVEMDGAEGDAFAGIEWEPGATRLIFLKVENKGTINVRYLLRFVADVEALYGAFEYCSFRGDYSMLDSLKASSWEELSSSHTVKRLETNVGERIGPENRISGENFVSLEVDGIDFFVVALHMRDTAGNEYQSKSCTVRFNIYAEQGNMR